MYYKIMKSEIQDNLNHFLKEEDNLNFLKMEDNHKKIIQPKTFKNKNNDCGTALGTFYLQK
jgi:hypothetical protein